MSDWRPIETVGDVKRILGIPKSKKIIYIYRWVNDRFPINPRPLWRTDSNKGILFDLANQPILWQPLPELPEDF